MKRLWLLVLPLLVAGCSTDEVEQVPEPTEVTLTFSPYEMEAMTRTVTSVATVVTRLDVWLVSGGDVIALQQTKDDADFGSLTVTLDKTKTYTLYAVGHKADGATLSDGVISFTDDKVTHAMYYTETFSPATKTSLSCEMSRIVAQFQFNTTDVVPDDVTKMTLTIAGVYDRWNVTTGATHSLDRTSTFDGFSKKADGTVTFNIYAIVTDAQTLHDITVTAMDADDNILQQRTFADVPLRNGYRTSYRGTYFTNTATSATFTINDWNSYDEVNF